FKKAFAEAAAASPDGRPMINRHGVGSNIEYYQFPNEKKLFTENPIYMNNYFIDGGMPAIDWKTSGDTATFGGLHCQKATCHFKGRDYIAWFCPDLPVHVGPWKLNGLPGVIVEAYDAKKDVVFKFDHVEKAVLGAPKPIKDKHGRILPPLNNDDDNTDPNIIKVPTNGIKTTDKELAKLQKARGKDPNAQVQSMRAATQSNDGPK